MQNVKSSKLKCKVNTIDLIASMVIKRVERGELKLHYPTVCHSWQVQNSGKVLMQNFKAILMHL